MVFAVTEITASKITSPPSSLTKLQQWDQRLNRVHPDSGKVLTRTQAEFSIIVVPLLKTLASPSVVPKLVPPHLTLIETINRTWFSK